VRKSLKRLIAKTKKLRLSICKKNFNNKK